MKGGGKGLFHIELPWSSPAKEGGKKERKGGEGGDNLHFRLLNHPFLGAYARRGRGGGGGGGGRRKKKGKREEGGS